MRDFERIDKFELFVSNLIGFARSAISYNQTDNSPENVFDADENTLLTKFGEKIYYKDTNSEAFVSISDKFPDVVQKNSQLLNTGINTNSTWVSRSGYKKWKHSGFFSPFFQIGNACTCVSGSV